MAGVLHIVLAVKGHEIPKTPAGEIWLPLKCQVAGNLRSCWVEVLKFSRDGKISETSSFPETNLFRKLSWNKDLPAALRSLHLLIWFGWLQSKVHADKCCQLKWKHWVCVCLPPQSL